MPTVLSALGFAASLTFAAPPSDRSAPASGAGRTVPTPAEPAVEAPAAPTDPYDTRAAIADLETVIGQTGKAFLAARERLEQSPEATRAALLELRQRSDLDAAARARLDAVEGRLPDTTSIDDLRAKLLSSAKLGLDFEETLERLSGRGAAAVPHLLQLARDRDLTVDVRARMLGEAIGLSEHVGDYVAYVGGGDPKLQRALRRALLQRARAEPDRRTELVAALDDAVRSGGGNDAPTPEQIAGRVALRAALGDVDDVTSAAWASTAIAEQAPFVVRVAVIRALTGDARAEAELETAARALLPGAVPPEGPSGTSSLATDREVLGALALAALSTQAASRVVRELDLTSAAAPRIAATAWRVVELSPDPNLEWLKASRAHAWPEVRVAALDRVGPGCTRVGAKRLSDIAGRDERSADPEPQVARAAIRALGRCRTNASEAALRGVLADAGIRVELRGDAALALVESSGDGVVAVANALLIAEDEPLAEVLLDALATVDPLPAVGGEAGCATAPRFARLAPRALRLAERAVPAGSCLSTATPARD